jgi:hypothetical protein
MHRICQSGKNDRPHDRHEKWAENESELVKQEDEEDEKSDSEELSLGHSEKV